MAESQTMNEITSGRRSTPPFRADHVGSLLRPKELLQAREDCPWYPSARLLRQPKLNDWKSVVERTRAELQVLAGECKR